MKKLQELLKKNKKNFILWCLFFTIFIMLMIGIRMEFVRLKRVEIQMEEASQEKIENNQQIKQYQEEIENLKLDYKTQIAAKSCILLFFEHFEESAYRDIITEMEKYNFHGIIVFQDGKTPGMPGAISVELYQELLDKGWEGAIANSEKISVYDNLPKIRKEAWKQYITDMQKAFADKGLSVPAIYIPHTEESTDEIKKLLSECDITQTITFYSSAEDAATEMSVNVTDMGTIVGKYRYNELVSDLGILEPQAESMGLLFREVEFGAPINKQHTSAYMFKEQLKILDKMSSVIQVTTYSEYIQYQRTLVEENELVNSDYMSKIQELENNIAILKEKNREKFEKIFK